MKSPRKFFHVTQIIMQNWSCDQSLVALVFLRKKLSKPQFYKDLTRKKTFFKAWSWFKFNNLRLAMGMTLKFYTSMAKRVETKSQKVLGANSYVYGSYRGKTGRVKDRETIWKVHL